MFTLTVVYFDMNPVFPVGLFEMMFVLHDCFAFKSTHYTIKFTELT